MGNYGYCTHHREAGQRRVRLGGKAPLATRTYAAGVAAADVVAAGDFEQSVRRLRAAVKSGGGVDVDSGVDAGDAERAEVLSKHARVVDVETTLLDAVGTRRGSKHGRSPLVPRGHSHNPSHAQRQCHGHSRMHGHSLKVRRGQSQSRCLAQ